MTVIIKKKYQQHSPDIVNVINTALNLLRSRTSIILHKRVTL